MRGGTTLLWAAHDRFSELGDRWEANRTLLDLGEAGADIDTAATLSFFEGLKAVDEAARAATLHDPVIARQ